MLRRVALVSCALGLLVANARSANARSANAPTLTKAQRALVEVDRVRIQRHLELVESLLRARDVSHLSESLKAARARNLDLLHRYWKAGVFPHNHRVAGRRPIFIDDGGRACAVGYLMLHNGGAAAARAVAARENLAYVEQIKTRGAHTWIATSGLTAAEAALIQPSYNFLDSVKPLDAGQDAKKDTTAASDTAPKADTGTIPTKDDGGCAIAGAPAGQVIPLVLIGLLLALRRRRRRRG
ncbi:MAG: hypothetical protein KC503_28210 [Myxococcales bacterium]|nr:hypothetical protein [Myxococcales bacterium]